MTTVKALSISPRPSHLPTMTSHRRNGFVTNVWMVPEAISPATVSTEMSRARATARNAMP